MAHSADAASRWNGTAAPVRLDPWTKPTGHEKAPASDPARGLARKNERGGIAAPPDHHSAAMA